MNADEALRQFGSTRELPRAALQWALDNWEAAAPRFLARLRAFAAAPAARDVAAGDEAFFVVHLCGEMRETRAYAPLCRLIGESEDALDWLGDAVTATLHGILINLCDGDPQPLMEVVEAGAADEFARAAALQALGWLARGRAVLSDDAMRAYLMRLRREMKPREPSYVWQIWAETAANLGYDDFRSELVSLHAAGLVEPREFGLKHFDGQVKLARKNATGLAGFEADRVSPFEKAVDTLATWSYGDALVEELRGADNGFVFEEPYVNPLRGIGRNDSCPCGSGKKYKRCCLAG
jgi:hypothetical protein